MGSDRVGELRALEGHHVSLALLDGSRIDDCQLVSACRNRAGTVWLFTGGIDTFVPLREIVELRGLDLPLDQVGVQLPQRRLVEPGPDLSGIPKPITLVVADEQRAETGPAALRVGPARDDELLAGRALQLAPRRRPARFVLRVDPLGDEALPASRAGVVEQLGWVAVQLRHDLPVLVRIN